MAIAIEPEFGIEIPEGTSYMDLRVRAEAACNTLHELERNGVIIPPPDDVDNTIATTLSLSYAADARGTSLAVTDHRASTLTAAVIQQTDTILKDFGHLVATRAHEIRNLITNKLILETENGDARIRLRALELLGKIEDVGLFSERKQVTVTHQNSAQIREKLRGRLVTLQKNSKGVYEPEGAEGASSNDESADADGAIVSEQEHHG